MKFYIKYFWKKGKAPFNISLNQAGAGHLVEIPCKQEEMSDVQAKLNDTLASRDLKIGELKYDAEYGKASGYIFLSGSKSNTL